MDLSRPFVKLQYNLILASPFRSVKIWMTLTNTLIDYPAYEGITIVDFNIFTAHYAIEPDPSYRDSYKYYIMLYETIVVTAMIQLTICVDDVIFTLVHVLLLENLEYVRNSKNNTNHHGITLIVFIVIYVSW